MGRNAERWEELRQEADEWAQDPQAQQEYDEWNGKWTQRYPTEQEHDHEIE